MSDRIRIALNGKVTEIADVPATTTLLDWLRSHARLTGTKEGCAEGDCGACTVVLEFPSSDGGVCRSAINACITMIGQVDGLGVRTVEGLASDNGKLHPVQEALAGGGATQCGFCTPGIVMSAYALSSARERPDLGVIHDALAGNLCRCTGYRPIVDALRDGLLLKDAYSEDRSAQLRSILCRLSRDTDVCFVHAECRFFAPRSLTEALQLRAENPQAILLAGGTDLGLLVSRDRKPLTSIIYLGKVGELQKVESTKGGLIFGSAVSYARLFELLTKNYPRLSSYWTRIGSRQIRNMGTVGGNIGTASPIGDSLPILLALNAQIRLRSSRRGSREVAADGFFIGYRKTPLAADELIEAVRIPKLPAGATFFVDKISKRRDQDISTVCGAYRLNIKGTIVSDACVAFGGLAEIPKRAKEVEKTLVGRKFDEEAIGKAQIALANEFHPISDCRGTAEYRLAVAKNLLERLYLRVTDPALLVECEAL